MITITSVKNTGSSMSVSWTNSFEEVSSLSIVFDDNGSCTTIGLDPALKNFSTSILSMHRTYDVYLKALTPSGWIISDSKTHRLA
jgi:hypothetical protein